MQELQNFDGPSFKNELGDIDCTTFNITLFRSHRYFRKILITFATKHDIINYIYVSMYLSKYNFKLYNLSLQCFLKAAALLFYIHPLMCISISPNRFLLCILQLAAASIIRCPIYYCYH